MRRITILTVGFAALAVAAVALLGRGPSIFRPNDAAPAADSVWYHASDVAQVAQTGRPQLVEFFHPG